MLLVDWLVLDDIVIRCEVVNSLNWYTENSKIRNYRGAVA